MAADARSFVENWVEENVRAEGYEPEGDQSEAAQKAEQCLHEAEAAGIRRVDIEAAFGDLTSYMADAIERANDEEVRRLAEKDD